MTCLVLLEAGHRRVAELAGLQTPAEQERLQLLGGDIRNPEDLVCSDCPRGAGEHVSTALCRVFWRVVSPCWPTTP